MSLEVPAVRFAEPSLAKWGRFARAKLSYTEN